MRPARVCCMLLCLLLVIALVGSADAKKKKHKGKRDKKEKVQLDDRQLKGHRFLRPFRFPLAIPTTNIGVGLGYAYSRWNWDEKLDLVIFNDDDFTQGGLNETMDVEVEFLNRFSLELLLEGRALAGADENSALLYGGQALYSATFIPKVMLYQNDNWGSCFSISSDVIYDQGVQSSPIVLMVNLIENMTELLEEIERKQELPSERELRKVTNIKIQDALITQDFLSIRPSLLIAQTIHPVLGLQVGIRYNYGIRETVDGPDMFDLDAGDPPSSLLIGSVLTFDLNPISRAHVGFKGELDYEMENDDGEDIRTIITGGGIMYTGRENLELGATFFYETSDWEDLSYDLYYLILNMRYFF